MKKNKDYAKNSKIGWSLFWMEGSFIAERGKNFSLVFILFLRPSPQPLSREAGEGLEEEQSSLTIGEKFRKEKSLLQIGENLKQEISFIVFSPTLWERTKERAKKIKHLQIMSKNLQFGFSFYS